MAEKTEAQYLRDYMKVKKAELAIRMNELEKIIQLSHIEAGVKADIKRTIAAIRKEQQV